MSYYSFYRPTDDRRLSFGADLQEAFEQVDEDRDGVINVEQLEQIALSLGLKLSRAQAEAVVSRFGTKGQYS